MILKFTAVLLACVLGASLGRPIEKRNATTTPCVDYTATTTPCVDYTANYRKANSIMLESVKRVCRAVKDLDMFINVTGEQCTKYPQVQNRSNFDDVLDDLEEVYLPLTTLAIHYGRSIDNTSCITLENENVRFNISIKLASVQTALEDLVSESVVNHRPCVHIIIYIPSILITIKEDTDANVSSITLSSC